MACSRAICQDNLHIYARAIATVVALPSATPHMAMGVSARAPRRPTPVEAWIGLIWNGLLMGVILLLCLAGSLMGA